MCEENGKTCIIFKISWQNDSSLISIDFCFYFLVKFRKNPLFLFEIFHFFYFEIFTNTNSLKKSIFKNIFIYFCGFYTIYFIKNIFKFRNCITSKIMSLLGFVFLKFHFKSLLFLICQIRKFKIF